MKERPILFSGPMVQAILDGRKTQTRRVVKPQPEYWEQTGGYHYPLDKKPYRGAPVGRVRSIDEYRCPYGQPGDRLWVRETWHQYAGGEVIYRADYGPESYQAGAKGWRPSIFMPRWASRITLEITGVRVERVQDISADDARAEGVSAPDVLPRSKFATLWDSINAKRGYGWDMNPWCWCVEFKAVQP
jgi:hypothetical protein